MRRFLFVVGGIGVVVLALGFYQGWFQFGSDKAGGKSSVKLSVDTDKLQADGKTAVANVQDVGRQMKDKVLGSSEKSMEGTVVRISNDKLTMANKEGKEHGHALNPNIKWTCDGKTCAVGDLKAGMKIRVTLNDAAPHAASRIDALDKDAEFAINNKEVAAVGNRHDGKFVSISGYKLVMSGMDGKDEQTCTMTAGIKITCDGKLCKASDLKPGMRIRVTSEAANADAAVRIEAIDKDLDFEKTT